MAKELADEAVPNYGEETRGDLIIYFQEQIMINDDDDALFLYEPIIHRRN
jgi:hypothetical protein